MYTGYKRYKKYKITYNSEEVVLMVVNYTWKPDHLSQVIYYFIGEKKLQI